MTPKEAAKVKRQKAAEARKHRAELEEVQVRFYLLGKSTGRDETLQAIHEALGLPQLIASMRPLEGDDD